MLNVTLIDPETTKQYDDPPNIATSNSTHLEKYRSIISKGLQRDEQIKIRANNDNNKKKETLNPKESKKEVTNFAEVYEVGQLKGQKIKINDKLKKHQNNKIQINLNPISQTCQYSQVINDNSFAFGFPQETPIEADGNKKNKTSPNFYKSSSRNNYSLIKINNESEDIKSRNQERSGDLTTKQNNSYQDQIQFSQTQSIILNETLYLKNKKEHQFDILKKRLTPNVNKKQISGVPSSFGNQSFSFTSKNQKYKFDKSFKQSDELSMNLDIKAEGIYDKKFKFDKQHFVNETPQLNSINIFKPPNFGNTYNSKKQPVSQSSVRSSIPQNDFREILKNTLSQIDKSNLPQNLKTVSDDTHTIQVESQSIGSIDKQAVTISKLDFENNNFKKLATIITEKSQGQSFTSGPGSPQQMYPQFQEKSSEKSIIMNNNLLKFRNNNSLQQFDGKNYLQSQDKLNHKQNLVNLPTSSVKILLANIKKEQIQLNKNNQLPAGKQVNWAYLSQNQQYQVLQQINICENLLANHEGIIQKAVNGFLESQDQLTNLLLNDEDIDIFVQTIKQRALNDLKNIVDKIEGIPGYQFKDALNYLLLKNKIQNDLNNQRQVNLSFLPFMLSRESARVKQMTNNQSRSQQSRQNKFQTEQNQQIRGRSEINCSVSMAYYEQTIIDSLLQQIKSNKSKSSEQYIVHSNLPKSLQCKKQEFKEKNYQKEDLELTGFKIKTEEKEEDFKKDDIDKKKFFDKLKNMSLPSFKKKISQQNSNPTSSNMVSRDYTLNQENSILGFQSGPNLFMHPSQELANAANSFNKNTVSKQISQSAQDEINKILQISSSKDLIAQQELEKYNKKQDEMKVEEQVGKQNPPEQFYEVRSNANDDQFHNKTENTEHANKEFQISENDNDENKLLINAAQGQEISYINLDKTNLQSRFIPNSALHVRTAIISGSNQIFVMPNSISEESKTSQISQYNNNAQKTNESQRVDNLNKDKTKENFSTKSINYNNNKSSSKEKTSQKTFDKPQQIFQSKRQSIVKPINVYMHGNKQTVKQQSLDLNGLLVSKYSFGNKKNFTVLNPIQCPILSQNQKITLLSANKNPQKSKQEMKVEIAQTFTQENNSRQSQQFSQGSKTDEQFEIPKQNIDQLKTKTDNKIQQNFKGLIGERHTTASPDYKSRKQTDIDKSSLKDEEFVEIKKTTGYTQKKRSSVGNQISLYEGISVRSTDNQRRKKIMNNSDLNDFIQSGSDISSTQRVRDQNYIFNKFKINDQSIISNKSNTAKKYGHDFIVQNGKKIANNDNIKFDENSPIHTGYVRINTQNDESDEDKEVNKFMTTPNTATIKDPNKNVNLNLGEPTLYPDSLLELSGIIRKSSLDKQKINLSARNQMEMTEGDQFKVEQDGDESQKQIHLPALIQRKRLTAAVKLPAQKQSALRVYKDIRNNKMQSCVIKQARQQKFEQQFQKAFQKTIRNNFEGTRNNFQINLDNYAGTNNSLTPNFNFLLNENQQRPSALAILNSTETNFRHKIIQQSDYSQDLSSELDQETPWIMQFVAGGPPSLHYGVKTFTSQNNQGFLSRGSVPVTDTHFREKNSISTNKIFSQIQDNSNTTISGKQQNNKMRNFSVEYSDNSYKYTVPQILKGSAGVPVVPALKEILRQNKMSQTVTNKLFINHRQTEPFIANKTMAQTINEFIKIKN